MRTGGGAIELHAQAADDWAYFMSEASLAQRQHLREKVLSLERVERVTAETEIAPGIHVQPAPGHTPGHMIVRAEGLRSEIRTAGIAVRAARDLPGNMPPEAAAADGVDPGAMSEYLTHLPDLPPIPSGCR